MHNHKLTISIHPSDWLDDMLPTYTNLHKKTTTPHEISIVKLCTWSNEKAKLMLTDNAVKYPTFTESTPQEFEQYLYLLFWNGMNPSPKIEWNLQSKELDTIKSSAFLRRLLGPATSLRLRHLRYCFDCQYPKISVPSKKTHPNFKVDE